MSGIHLTLFRNSIFFKWIWFGLEILWLVWKKAFFKILNGFHIILPFILQKSCTASYYSWKNVLNCPQMVWKERTILCRTLALRSAQTYFSPKKCFWAKRFMSLKTYFLVKLVFPFAQQKSSALFWNQYKIKGLKKKKISTFTGGCVIFLV